ncbi:hypothetical protein HDU78_006803 [Chytriomyces hyalinus]|nr:hypothetical protein HDU78_006803 [Chytriomyces hyalinus]
MGETHELSQEEWQTLRTQLAGLHLVRILSENAMAKSAVLLLSKSPLSIPSGSPEELISQIERAEAGCLSLLIVEKTPFSTEDFGRIITLPSMETTTPIAVNDIYARLLSHMSSACKLSYIHPATTTHIRKHIPAPFVKVTETPAMYAERVLPYINSLPASRTLWITKIIAREAEANDILGYFDATSPTASDGFILVPDSKWDRVTLANLYLLVLAANSDLKSLRDLRGHHIPFLNRVKNEVEALVKRMYGIEATSLRLYCHYQPSYYHFHIHVVNAQTEPTGGMAAGQAHLLEDMINNLELDPEYYSKKTITYYLAGQHDLFSVLK